MAEDRPNLSKEEVKKRTIDLIKDKPEYKDIIKRILAEMEADHEDHRSV